MRKSLAETYFYEAIVKISQLGQKFEQDTTLKILDLFETAYQTFCLSSESDDCFACDSEFG